MKEERKEHLNMVYKALTMFEGRPKFNILNKEQSEIERFTKSGGVYDIDGFMDKYKITTDEMLALKRRDSYVNDIRTQAVLYAKEQLPAIMDKATQKAKDARSVKDIKDWADMIEDLKKKVVDNPDEVALFDRLTDKDYRRIIRREVNSFAAEKGIFDTDFTKVIQD